MSGRSLEEFRDMTFAPRTGEPVLLLIYDSGRLRPYVGEFQDGGWISRVPGSSEKVSVLPRKWCPIPDAPAVAGQ
jgi:hypothetical protein